LPEANLSKEQTWEQRFLKEFRSLKAKNPEKYATDMVEWNSIIQFALARFGFGTLITGEIDQRTILALKEYQQVRGLKVTGKIDEPTMNRLGSDLEIDLDPSIVLPVGAVYVDDWENGYISARGTWVFTNSENVSSRHTSEMMCLRDLKICVESRAGLNEPPYLTVRTMIYDIEKWDSVEISMKRDSGCNRTINRVIRATQQVTGIEMQIDNQGGCAGVAKPEVHMRLASGSKDWGALYEAERKARKTKRDGLYYYRGKAAEIMK